MMAQLNPQHLDVGEGDAARRIAVLARPGEAPPVVWLGGFGRTCARPRPRRWTPGRPQRAGLRPLRLHGHGESSGRFEEATISRWLEDTLAVLERFAPGRPILVGSSMGGWISLLAARELASSRPDGAPAGLVLIAPAVDFTERLMWERFRTSCASDPAHRRAPPALGLLARSDPDHLAADPGRSGAISCSDARSWPDARSMSSRA
jgi:pimeloyl-ACP methyl ester carboxylesterase